MEDLLRKLDTGSRLGVPFEVWLFEYSFFSADGRTSLVVGDVLLGGRVNVFLPKHMIIPPSDYPRLNWCACASKPRMGR